MIGNDAVNDLDLLGLASSELIDIKKCSIFIVIEHNAHGKDWTWNVSGCAAGGALTCFPDSANAGLPAGASIPGTPNHDGQMEDPRTQVQKNKQSTMQASRDSKYDKYDPALETDYNRAIINMLEGAKVKAREICSGNCCAEIKVIVEDRSGFIYRRKDYLFYESNNPIQRIFKFDCKTLRRGH
jgi:hypothetical protein